MITQSQWNPNFVLDETISDSNSHVHLPCSCSGCKHNWILTCSHCSQFIYLFGPGEGDFLGKKGWGSNPWCRVTTINHLCSSLFVIVLGINTYFSTLELGLHKCNAHNKGCCGCLLDIAQVLVHVVAAASQEKSTHQHTCIMWKFNKSTYMCETIYGYKNSERMQGIKMVSGYWMRSKSYREERMFKGTIRWEKFIWTKLLILAQWVYDLYVNITSYAN